MSKDANGRNHTTAGTPTSGQYATEAKAAPDVALVAEAPGTQAQQATIRELTYALARAVGVDAGALQVDVNVEQGCGVPAGSFVVRIDGSPLDDEADKLSTLVGFRALVGADGCTADARVDVEYDEVRIPSASYAVRAAVVSDFDPSEDVMPHVLGLKVAQVLDQARLQRAMDVAFNRPQRDANASTGTRYGATNRGWHDILSIDVARGGPNPVLRVAGPQRGTRTLDLVVNLESGEVLRGDLNTDFGHVTLEYSNLETVVGNLDRELVWALPSGDRNGGTKQQFEARIAAVLKT